MKKTLIMGLILAVVMILTPLAVQGTVEKEETVVLKLLQSQKPKKPTERTVLEFLILKQKR